MVFLDYSQGGRNLGISVAAGVIPELMFSSSALGVLLMYLSLPSSSEIKAFATFLAAEEQMCV